MLGICLFVANLTPSAEVELFGYAALVFLAAHLFNGFIWPSLRDCVCIVWTDVMAGARRALRDLRSLRE